MFMVVMLHQGQARVHAAKGRGEKTSLLVTNVSKNGRLTGEKG
jgi:hypothetical protein